MYTANAIRNVCLLGHSGSGKSALAEEKKPSIMERLQAMPERPKTPKKPKTHKEMEL